MSLSVNLLLIVIKIYNVCKHTEWQHTYIHTCVCLRTLQAVAMPTPPGVLPSSPAPSAAHGDVYPASGAASQRHSGAEEVGSGSGRGHHQVGVPEGENGGRGGVSLGGKGVVLNFIYLFIYLLLLLFIFLIFF